MTLSKTAPFQRHQPLLNSYCLRIIGLHFHAISAAVPDMALKPPVCTRSAARKPVPRFERVVSSQRSKRRS